MKHTYTNNTRSRYDRLVSTLCRLKTAMWTAKLLNGHHPTKEQRHYARRAELLEKTLEGELNDMCWYGVKDEE